MHKLEKSVAGWKVAFLHNMKWPSFNTQPYLARGSEKAGLKVLQHMKFRSSFASAPFHVGGTAVSILEHPSKDLLIYNAFVKGLLNVCNQWCSHSGPINLMFLLVAQMPTPLYTCGKWRSVLLSGFPVLGIQYQTYIHSELSVVAPPSACIVSDCQSHSLPLSVAIMASVCHCQWLSVPSIARPCHSLFAFASDCCSQELSTVKERDPEMVTVSDCPAFAIFCQLLPSSVTNNPSSGRW